MKEYVLYKKENEELKEFCWVCGNCNLTYKTREQAATCCQPKICSVCGKEISQDRKNYMEAVFYVDGPTCGECYEKYQESLKEVWTEEEYLSKNKETNNTYSPIKIGDDFYEDLYDAIQYLYDDGYTEEQIKQTCFTVCQVCSIPKLDVDSALEHIVENMDLDCYPEDIFTDLDKLNNFVEEWNKKQTFKYWESQNIRVIPSEESIKEYFNV